MTKQFDYDARPDIVADFDRLPRIFMPGYDASHIMAAALLKLAIGDTGHILAVGAGGGAELARLAQSADWTFTAVDPSLAMLGRARDRLTTIGAADRLTMCQGTSIDAPTGPFDAATAFLALHFVPDDGQRLVQLKAIHARLKPGAQFLMINGATDKATAAFDRDLARYRMHARLNGADTELLEQAEEMQRLHVHLIPSAREIEMLEQAGFRGIELFYKAFWIEGWCAWA